MIGRGGKELCPFGSQVRVLSRSFWTIGLFRILFSDSGVVHCCTSYLGYMALAFISLELEYTGTGSLL